jgi:bacterioferritin-associated ferredoxin
MYVCLCRGMTASALRKLGASGVTSPEDLIARLGLDEADACGFCLLHIDEIANIAEGGVGGDEIIGTTAQVHGTGNLGAKNGRQAGCS